MAEVDVPIRLRGSADAKHHYIRRTKSLFIQRASPQPSRGNIFLDKAVQSGFKKRRLRVSDRFHFIDIAVNAEHTVPNFSQTGGAHTANVSQAHYDYVLVTIHAVRLALIRR